MAEIEKIAAGNGGRYRIRSHDQILTVSANDLLEIANYALRHRQELLQESEGEPTARTLPGEPVPTWEGQEFVDWFHEDDVSADNPAIQLEEE